MVEVKVFNDCGDDITDAHVVVTFSNGDPPLLLQPVGGPLYVATAQFMLRANVSLVRLAAIAVQASTGWRATAGTTVLLRGLNLSQTGFTFQVASGATPAMDGFYITDIGPSVSFTVSATTRSGGPWLRVSPSASVVDPLQAPVNVGVIANPAGLAPGDYYGLIRVDAPGVPNSPLFATVVLRVLPAGQIAPVQSGLAQPQAQSHASAARSGDCIATKVNPTIRFQTAAFLPIVSFPAPLIVNVLDDCKQPMPLTGVVTVSFDNGDLPLTLTSQGSGTWSGTWSPQSVSKAAVMITAKADSSNLTGTVQMSTALDRTSPAPILSAGGTVSAASFSSSVDRTTGEMVAIFGANLATDTVVGSTLPLVPQLGETLLSLSGQPLPLLFVSANQVNAILPYGLTVGTPYQLIAVRGARQSTVLQVTVAAGDPAVFSADSSGRGQGAIYRVAPGPVVRADASNPANAGDTLLLYCAGLGALDSAVADGSAAPLDRLVHTTGSVTASIGGVSAPVAFAGLAPGLAAGLYQVNVTVPSGVAPGNQVAVVITAGGISTQPVLVAVQ